MNLSDAALTALYPVMVVLGLTVWIRFLPVLRQLENGTRTMVCASLMIVATVIYEQVLFGWGRLTGAYLSINASPLWVGLGKVSYTLGMCYLLYAFWQISPARPRLTAPLAWAAGACVSVLLALLY